MGKISRGVKVMRISWDFVNQDKTLLLFPLMSALTSTLAVIVSLPFIFGIALAGQNFHEVSGVIIGVILTYITVSIAVFWNVALARVLDAVSQGQDVTLKDGIRAARERLPKILGWAAVATVVSVVLNLIYNLAENLPQPAKLISEILLNLMGFAWAVLTFFVIPAIAYDNLGPIDAIKKSGQTIRARWGEALVGNIGFGFIGFLIALAVIGVFGGLGFVLIPISPILGAAVIVLGVIVLFAVAMVMASLKQVFINALYRYAQTGEVSMGFDEALLAEAFAPRKKKGLFSSKKEV